MGREPSGLYRCALRVENTEAAMSLVPNSVEVMGDPVWCPLPGTKIEGLYISFLRSPDGVVFEFVEAAEILRSSRSKGLSVGSARTRQELCRRRRNGRHGTGGSTRAGARGASVVVVGRDADRGKNAAEELAAAGAESAHSLAFNVSQAGAAVAAVDEAVRILGRLDGIAITMGTAGMMPIDADDDAWDTAFHDVPLATTRSVQAALPHLAVNGGAIVTTAAYSARSPHGRGCRMRASRQPLRRSPAASLVHTEDRVSGPTA